MNELGSRKLPPGVADDAMPHTAVDPLWATGRITLLGDAIHATPLTLDEGANLALRDAQLLTQQLKTATHGEQPCCPRSPPMGRACDNTPPLSPAPRSRHLGPFAY